MCENRFYVCEHCGNLVNAVHDCGVPMMCCGQEMTELVANTVEASREKHLPVVEVAALRAVSSRTVVVRLGRALKKSAGFLLIAFTY